MENGNLREKVLSVHFRMNMNIRVSPVTETIHLHVRMAEQQN